MLNVNFRVRAASLYIVIVVALVIALLCEAMITTAFYYRSYHLKSKRYSQLKRDAYSGINLLLTEKEGIYYESKPVELFPGQPDSLQVTLRFWGGFDIGTSAAHVNKDSVAKTFFIGAQIDSSKWAAIYLADEDRPLSLTGKTAIRGDVYLPKSGIRAAYMNGKGYEGSAELINGHHYNSSPDLPGPDKARLSLINAGFNGTSANADIFAGDSLHQSFFTPVKQFHFAGQVTLRKMSLSGNIIVRCDSTIRIDSTVRLDNVIIFAKAIVIADGFKGRCQLFARDSVSIGNRVELSYPSMVAVVRKSAEQSAQQGIITFGNKNRFYGAAMIAEDVPGAYKPVIRLGKNMEYSGQLYASIISLGDHSVIHGSIFCKRFLYRSEASIYENFLVDVNIDQAALSRFYCCPFVMPAALNGKKKIVQWVN